MLKRRCSLSIVLLLCLVLQGSGLSSASAKGVADCGTDMKQMEMVPMSTQQLSHDHSAMLHGIISSESIKEAADELASVETDCCDVDEITRGDCTDMPDCQSCGSMISLSIPNRSALPVAAPRSTTRWLHILALRAFSPSDLWRPPIMT